MCTEKEENKESSRERERWGRKKWTERHIHIKRERDTERDL